MVIQLLLIIIIMTIIMITITNPPHEVYLASGPLLDGARRVGEFAAGPVAEAPREIYYSIFRKAESIM